MNYSQILQQAQDTALTYYKTHHAEGLFYHNVDHTNDVVAAATQIANHYQLSDRDFCIVLTAAWFHDLGYFEDADHHEDKGAEIATTFLEAQKADAEFIAGVKGCITATKMPQSPTNLLEQIICDADLFHLGTDEFENKDKLIRQEIKARYNKEFSKQEWRIKAVGFLEEHHYQTDYCQLLLSEGQAKNLENLKKKIAKKEEKLAEKEAENVEEDTTIVATSDAKPDDKKGSDNHIKPKKKKNSPDKGIETMFRISSSNHQRLSNMADNKAHIMITVNSIIMSAVISLVLRRLSEYQYLLIPTVILLAVSLTAMTFSILSTRPSIPEGVFTREQVDEQRVNLLFFGNFYKMNLEEYTYGMTQMMQSSDFLYGSLIRDVYSQGVVLGKKYQYLRIAYNVFMFGLIFAVAAFVIAAVFFSHDVVLPAAK